MSRSKKTKQATMAEVEESLDEREARLRQERDKILDKKAIVEGALREIRAEEKMVNEEILKCLNERKCPLLLKMAEVIEEE